MKEIRRVGAKVICGVEVRDTLFMEGKGALFFHKVPSLYPLVFHIREK